MTAMKRVRAAIRRLRKSVRYFAGYFDFSSHECQRVTDFARCGRPVLLLYGFFTNRCVLEVLERRLRRDGYCVFSFDLGGLAHSLNTRGIRELAELVHEKVERLYERNPGMGPLTVVGHSKGGLIGAYYAKNLDAARRTRLLVTLATPHRGTPLGYAGLPFGLLARSLWQMTPASPFIRRLSRAPWPRGVRVVSIHSREDRVVPSPSAALETAGLPDVRNVELEGVGHREFLYTKRAYDALLRELRDGAAREGGASGLPRDRAGPREGTVAS